MQYNPIIDHTRHILHNAVISLDNTKVVHMPQYTESIMSATILSVIWRNKDSITSRVQRSTDGDLEFIFDYWTRFCSTQCYKMTLDTHATIQKSQSAVSNAIDIVSHWYNATVSLEVMYKPAHLLCASQFLDTVHSLIIIIGRDAEAPAHLLSAS